MEKRWRNLKHCQQEQTRSAVEERWLLEWTHTHTHTPETRRKRPSLKAGGWGVVSGSLKNPVSSQGVEFLKSWRVFLPRFRAGPFEERWDAWLAHRCYITGSEPALNLLSQSFSSRPPGERKKPARSLFKAVRVCLNWGEWGRNPSSWKFATFVT